MTTVARRLLDASTLCAIATASPRGRPYVNTAYFAWSPDFDIVWISEPRARHSRNLAANRSAAIAVFDSTQSWGNQDRGIQLFGLAREAEGRLAPNAMRLYARRFPQYDEASFGAYRFYYFRPRRLKLFDEPSLGAGTFVRAIVRGGRLTWERTEIYRANS